MMSTPAHEHIAASLRDSIASGVYPPGSKLPPERELAVDFRVSRATIRHALDNLELEGLVIRRLGRSGGAFILGELPVVVINDLAGFMPQLAARGHQVHSILELGELIPADEKVASKLGLREGEEVHHVRRTRLVDGAALLAEDSYFPMRHTVGMLDHDLTGSLYQLLCDRFRQRPIRKRETVAPGIAGPREGACSASGLAVRCFALSVRHGASRR